MQDPWSREALASARKQRAGNRRFLRRGKHVRQLEKKPGVTSDWEEAERKRICK
jgi:hypothetical protein